MTGYSDADDYDDTHGGDARGRVLAADLSQHLRRGVLLDVGTGTGTLASALRELGFRVVGLDPAYPMLTKARTRLGSAVAVAVASELPVAASSVDNTLFAHVLHLVPDLVGALREAGRVLRPGGRCVAVHGVPTVVAASDLARVTMALEPLRLRTDGRDDIAAAARTAGLAVRAQDWCTPYPLTLTPYGLAEILRTRQRPYLRHLDATTWQAVVRPVIDGLRGLPGQHEPRTETYRVSMTVMTPPPYSSEAAS